MKILSAIFQGVVVSAAMGCFSMIVHKAGADYCTFTPAPDPFAPENIYSGTAENHRKFCETIKNLAPYNIIYPEPEK